MLMSFYLRNITFQCAKVTRLGLLGGLYYHSSVKSKSIMLPAMSLSGRIAGQHNSVKLQYSLTFNFLCVFSHARWARARPKEPHSRIPRPAFKKRSCILAAAILLVFRALKAILRV